MELSHELARRGHEVLHLYFADNLSTPKGNPGSLSSMRANCSIEGLRVGVRFEKHSLRNRRKADVAYGLAVAARVAWFKPDVVLSANTPLDAQNILQKQCRKQNAKFIFWLQDVYSSAIRFVVKQKLGRAATLAALVYERMEKKLLRSADAVVCIAPSFASIASDWGVPPHRLSVIENWAPLADVVPTARENFWARAHELGEKFCFVYSGTLGMKHRPELLLALANYLEERGDACLVVVAAGAGADWLQDQVRETPLRALKLLPLQPYECLSEVLGAADVLIGLLNSEAGAFAVPSKTLAYLCAGRPLILAAPHENHAATVVDRAAAGVIVSPDSKTEIIRAAIRLMQNRELRDRYATNARAYAESAFAIVPIADRFLEVCAKVTSQPEVQRGFVPAIADVIRESARAADTVNRSLPPASSGRGLVNERVS
jgi:glycosyltransferase involved in cell wall biosynthesis